jgi:GNAT superfamily N-acetyltransferase
MTMQMLIENAQPTRKLSFQPSNMLCVVPAQLTDCSAVTALFGALHAYNASLDVHFTLSDAWERIFHEQFCATCHDPSMMWLLVKDDDKPVGLMIAGVHTDSPLFCHRQWVEVQALYVADSHRGMGIAHTLLQRAYDWAAALNLPRVQLYVTATNVRAQSVYAEEGFATSQAIMRKKL